MSPEMIENLFGGFCAVSGSPVRPNDYNRYKLTLPLVGPSGGKRTGYMHYCCWPCVCDTQDFIRVDTKNVSTKEGLRQYHVAVIGDPCKHEERLHTEFVQPFDHRRTSVWQDAPEVRCKDGSLEGATFSDHGYVIISMFFDLPQNLEASVDAPAHINVPQPGRVQKYGSVNVQDEFEYSTECKRRADAGYNSGMGEIFRKVAEITPVPTLD